MVSDRGAHIALRARPVAALLVAALVTAGCGGGTDDIRNADGAVIAAGTWSVFDLRAGDCLDPAPGLTGDVAEIPVVPCSSAHGQETFGVVEHPDVPYPGASAVAQWADGACLAELDASFGLTLDDGVFISYLLPTFAGWNQDNDRRIVCVLVAPDGNGVTGSVVAGTAEPGGGDPSSSDDVGGR